MAAVGAATAMGSCITVPPADPPQVPALGPIILQDVVKPPADQYLTELPPQGFRVPVRVLNPTTTIACQVFVDFDTGSDNFAAATGLAYSCPLNTRPALDGGLTILTFTLTAASLADPPPRPGDNSDLTFCHTITFFVADGFATNAAHTPGDPSLGADSVTWKYTPNGPGNCQQFDAGDGAFPTDAPTDSTLLVPE